jgi:inosine/xanthosine triphosphatase
MNGRNDEKVSERYSSNSPLGITVAVGSCNPAKIRAVREAIQKVVQSHARKDRDEIRIEEEGFDVESGVAAQPMGDDETQLGSKNRALAAYHAFKTKNKKFADISVGIEGGLEWSADKKVLFCMAWMCCYGKRKAALVDLMGSSETKFYHGDKKPIFGFAKTASFAIPPPITKLVKQGFELGDADDKVFDRTNSKQKSGTVGVLSGGMINRSAYYEHALILAFTPWIRPDVYPNGCES